MKLKHEDVYGLFGSTKRPCLIVTTTNKDKKDRRSLKTDLIINKTYSVQRFIDEPVKYPYKLESGDVLAVEIDEGYATADFWALNKLQEHVGRHEFEKFELIAEVHDTLGHKYQSNKIVYIPTNK